MKKVLFTVLAAFVMTVAFTSCKDSKNSAKDKEAMEMDDMDDDLDDDLDDDMATMSSAASDDTPEAKAVAMMDGLVSSLKTIKVSSVDDVKAMAGMVKKFQSDMEELQAMAGDDYKSTLSEAEQKKIQEKMQNLSMSMMSELERIQKEAEAVGIDEKKLEDLLK